MCTVISTGVGEVGFRVKVISVNTMLWCFKGKRGMLFLYLGLNKEKSSSLSRLRHEGLNSSWGPAKVGGGNSRPCCPPAGSAWPPTVVTIISKGMASQQFSHSTAWIHRCECFQSSQACKLRTLTPSSTTTWVSGAALGKQAPKNEAWPCRQGLRGGHWN